MLKSSYHQKLMDQTKDLPGVHALEILFVVVVERKSDYRVRHVHTGMVTGLLVLLANIRMRSYCHSVDIEGCQYFDFMHNSLS